VGDSLAAQTGGESISDRISCAFVRDPDGYLIELIERK